MTEGPDGETDGMTDDGMTEDPNGVTGGGRRRPDVEGWPRRGACGEDRSEEIRLLEAHRCSRGRRRQRGEEHGGVHSPWTVQNQDQGEAGHQGWKENDVWQGGRCKGEASENGSQGVRCGFLETKHLSCSARWGFLCVDQFSIE